MTTTSMKMNVVVIVYETLFLKSSTMYCIDMKVDITHEGLIYELF